MTADTRSEPDDEPRAEALRSLASRLPANAAQCGFCGRHAAIQEVLPIDDRGVLCGECVEAIETAFGHGRPLS